MRVRVSRQVIDRQGFSFLERKDRRGAFSSAQSQLSIRLDSPLTAWMASGRLKQVWSTPDLSCRLRRSTQHLREVYSPESENLKSV
jgi:hypothetical protein